MVPRVEVSRILFWVLFAHALSISTSEAQNGGSHEGVPVEVTNLAARIELADAELNLLYGKVQSKVSKGEAELLKTEQREWIDRMEQYPVGSAARLDYLICRNQYLREILTEPKEGSRKSVTSPDGRSTVRIIDEPYSEKNRGSDENQTLEVLIGGVSVVKHPTFGFLLGCRWNADCSLVAINNRRGNSGDYIWVIDLANGTTLKCPDDQLGESWANKSMHQIPGNVRNGEAAIDCYWLNACSWEQSRVLRYRLEARVGPGGDIRDVAGLYDFKNSRARKSISKRELAGAENKVENRVVVCEGLKFSEDGPNGIPGSPRAEIVARMFVAFHGRFIVARNFDSDVVFGRISRGKILRSRGGGGLSKGAPVFPIRITYPDQHNRQVEEDYYYYVDEFDTWKAIRVR